MVNIMATFNLHKKILLTLLTGSLVVSFAMPVMAAHNRPYPEQANSSGQSSSHRSSSSSRAPHGSSGRPSVATNRSTAMQRPSVPPSGRLSTGPNRPVTVQRPSGVNRSSDSFSRQAGTSQRYNGPGPSTHPGQRPGLNSRPGPGPRFGHGPARPPYFGHRYRHGRPYNVIFHFGWPHRYYWWGARHRVYFGDFLLLVLILQAIQNANNQVTMDQLYAQHNSGLSYEDICVRYNLNWPSIYSRARFNYNNMETYAIGQNLTFCGWNDQLEW